VRGSAETGKGIIEGRCHGLPEIARAAFLEHFDQTEWVPWLNARDLLPSLASAGTAEENPRKHSA
jgi:hypothetical protein